MLATISLESTLAENKLTVYYGWPTNLLKPSLCLTVYRWSGFLCFAWDDKNSGSLESFTPVA
ncbi:hypothetical protein TSAR_012699 [Trichomalopsis sarcophagae]|uniref:Uncharacterized protein n=1 Tax=Trichomalopsis sarcophagae TaxID=543379 RepID=A0A232ETP6_9HYME|nr:hypothetical protein TSAR_012699 [Trichomalopsis sarcophagae]